MSAHHVLVGSGIAALSAAEEIRRRDGHARITMVGPEPDACYSRPGLPYFLDGTIPEARLAIRSPAELKELELDRVLGQATSFDAAAHTLTLGDGRLLRYDRLLLATGAASIQATFPGAGFEGVFRLDSLADARAIARAARPGRTAVVVGGGSTALELVEALAARGVHTHYLLRGDRYWARVLDPVESRMVEQRLETHGVVLHRRTEVARVVPGKVQGGLSRYKHLWSDAPPEPYRTRVAGVETQAGERIACDMLGVAVGIRPRLELAVAGGLGTERGILTDEYLRTSAPDVFAAGDLAQARDPLTGEALLDTLWSSAARQGRLAGANMTGATEADARPVAMNVTRLAGLTTTIVGAVEGGSDDPDLVTLTRGQSERWHAAPEAWSLDGANGRGTDRVRVILSRDAIVGAVVMGDQRLSRPLAQLVAARADVAALRPALVARPDALVPLLTELHRAWEAEHAPRA